MLLSVNITEKSFGAKNLFSQVNFSVSESEKVGIIGRNGIGKTTIFNILMGKDTDFTGDCILKRGTILVATDQEYANIGEMSVIEYILQGLPAFPKLYKILHDFTEIESPTNRQVRDYSTALEEFTNKNYYFVEDLVREELKNFQLEDKADTKFANLSGGEKRLAEVIKIMHSGAHLALIDEPTNYMDFVAKAKFINWLKQAPEAILVITHDRDVLSQVDRIIEFKDAAAIEYKGNYEQYLSQNTIKTSTGMNEYEIVQRQIENLKKQIAYARSKKASWGGTADKRNPFVVMETRCKKQLDELQKVEKPSFWIDKTSAANLNYKDASKYEKYKARNLRIGLKAADSRSKRTIFKVENLSIGYDKPLFAGKNFELLESGTLEIRGRNGAGKSTLIKSLLDDPKVQIFAGEIKRDHNIKIGIYEQEISKDYFHLNLHDAIEKIYHDKKLSANETKIRQLTADYLFAPEDLNIGVANLSGGQKARLQIIKMLADNPQLLILDEPTSHLDLPSIEELENALQKYSGAILYISHDNYFRRNLPAAIIEI
ncbi:MAG: ATP-binding cassette domain-containing protein [Candidatus Nomurabacteria bacterium]|jgi:ATPase subunit of ABC transporter with duplicated ATPase domains|nr:ATP-binding cassette domain-containing protein [Candidatus Nomurabacteria bacterium]